MSVVRWGVHERRHSESTSVSTGGGALADSSLFVRGGVDATTPARTLNSYSRGIQRTRVQVSAPFFVVLFQAFSVFERVALRKKKMVPIVLRSFGGF